MAKPPRPKHYSKKQQSRVEKEHTQRRIVLISTILVAVLVVLVIVYGILDQLVLQQTRPVAKVEGQKISIKDFELRAKYDRYNLIQNTALLEQYKQIFSFDQNSVSYYDSLIQQNVTELSDSQTLGQQVVQELVNDKVIALEAQKMGITVSDAEVDIAIEEAFGYYKNGTPTPAPTATPYATATYTDQQLTWVPPTSTPTAAATPTSESIATLESTALPPTVSETTAPVSASTTPGVEVATSTPVPPTATATATLPEPTATATTGPSATPLPTETPYTEQGFQTNYQNYLSNLTAETQFTDADLRAIFKANLLYQKVSDEVTKDVPTTEEYIWARHILVATEQEAQDVITRLNNGEDWDKISAEVSTDTATKDEGGDLGWFTKGVMDTAFETAAFGLSDIGQISAPVQSSFGWHVIQLLGKEVRPMTADRLQQAKQTDFNDWLTTTKDGLNIVTYDNWKTRVPTVPTTPSQYQQ